MPRTKKEVSFEEFTQRNLLRPFKNIVEELYKANQKIDELSKARTCKEGETPIAKSELKRLRQVETTLRRIMEVAKNETIPEVAKSDSNAEKAE